MDKSALGKKILFPAGAGMDPVLIGKRMAFVRASVKGLAVQEYERNPGLYSDGRVRWADGKASEEVRRLYEYMCIQL